MASGNWYFNMTLLRKNAARFWPIWGVYALLWVLMLPVGILSSRSTWDQTAAREYPLFLLDSPITVALALLFGLLCAMAVFSYLCSSRSAGMLHALPIRREGLFCTNYLSGLAFLLLPNLGVFLLGLLAAALNGAVVFSSLFTWLVAVSLMELYFYSFGVLCAMFTGHILALPALYLILSFLPLTLAYLVKNLVSTFLFGFSGAMWMEDWATWLTPAVKLLRGIGTHYPTGDIVRFYGLGPLTLYALVGVGMAGIALAFYRRRQLETAGDVISVKWLRPVFQYGVALCSALAIGAFFYAIFYQLLPTGAWTLLGWMLLWGAVGCFIAAMLLQKQFWVFKSSWKGCVVFLCCLTGILCLVELDVVGFERTIPKAAQVKRITIWGTDSSPYDSGNHSGLTVTEPEAIEQALALHQSIVDRKDALEAGLSQGEYRNTWNVTASGLDIQEEGYVSLTLDYTLTDGSVLARKYALPVTASLLEEPDSPAALLQGLLNRPELVYNAYLGRTLNNQEARYTGAALASLYDPEAGSYDYEVLPAQLAEPLLEAVKADILEGNLGRRYLLEDQERRDNCCYTDLELTFRDLSGQPGASAVPTNAGHASVTQAQTDPTFTITITLQKSAVHTMEVLKDYPNAFLSQTQVAQMEAALPQP